MSVVERSSFLVPSRSDGTPFMGTTDSGCVSQGVASLRDATNKGVEQSTSQPPCIRLPEDNKTRRWTNLSELPEGILHAAFGVPRMRASVCSVGKNRNRGFH
jgi:hypothetical protein